VQVACTELDYLFTQFVACFVQQKALPNQHLKTGTLEVHEHTALRLGNLSCPCFF
jgi:hypothetical protein